LFFFKSTRVDYKQGALSYITFCVG